MVPPLRYRVPAAALLLIGLCLLAFVGSRVHDGVQPEYNHGVVEIAGSELPRGEEVRRLDSFSAQAQEAFLAAVSTDGQDEARNPGPGLTHRSDVASEENTCIVRHTGSLYGMATLSGGPGGGLTVAILLTVGLPAALLVTAAGAHGLRAERPTYTAGLLAGILAAIAFYVFPESTRTGDLTPVRVVP